MKKLISLTIFLVLSSVATSAFAIGLLIPNQDGVRPFDVESHRATVTITNNAAVTKVEQVFRNHTNRPMEAVFVFPIPEGGTVSDFSLWINGKKTKGAVLEKKEARRIYESIVRRVEDPGLVEYMDGKLFRASIFPIPPKGTQKLELKFGQVLKPRGDVYQYKYPLSAGSQYVTAKTAADFTLTANINSAIPITTVYSPTHTIGTQRKSDGKVLVGTEEMHVALDRDFELFLGYSKKDIGVSLMTYDIDGDGGDHGYFMMALAPRFEAPAHDEIGQTFTFVMDTSGSMAGPKIEQARKTIAYCVKRLKPQDHFNIVRFSTGVEALFTGPQKAVQANKTEGIQFANELSPAGGTAIDAALQMALTQKTPKYQPHQIIFVTDGKPTVGDTNPTNIIRNARSHLKPNSRLFTFGIGYELNSVLLDGLATEGRGRADYVKPNQRLETSVAALFSRISSPVLSNLNVSFGGARVYDVYPNPLPDLFRGDQIVLFGRYRTMFNKPVVVSGMVGKTTKKFTFGGGKSGAKALAMDASSEAPLEFIPKLWATRKVGFLLDQIRRNGEQHELKNEVIRLAKKFGLVTPYTSYLAVDDSEFNNNRPRPQPEPVDLAQREPRGDFDGRGADSLLNKVERRPAKKGKDASAPRPSAAPMEAEEAFGGFGASSGESAVRASEQTRQYKESQKVQTEDFNTRRFVAGRTFQWKNRIWVQDGLSVKSKGKTIKMFSNEYFALAKKHKSLKQISKLGGTIIVKLGKTIYHIKP